MGVEPYLLASTLLGVLAQRLVRTLCPVCRRGEAPTAGERALLADMGAPAASALYAPVGCEACKDTGYRGRTGIYELLVTDDAMRRLIHDRAPEATLREAALRAGMAPMRRDGTRWLADGTTSLPELVRVTRES